MATLVVLFSLLASVLLVLVFFFLVIPRPPISTLFPYTTLFRSRTWREAASYFCLLPSAFCLLLFGCKTVGVSTTEKQKAEGDRKSTRLNSSHTVISYAVFCLKKKKTKTQEQYTPLVA